MPLEETCITGILGCGLGLKEGFMPGSCWDVVAELRLYIFFFDLAESKVAVFLCSILTSDGVPFSFGKNSFP